MAKYFDTQKFKVLNLMLSILDHYGPFILDNFTVLISFILNMGGHNKKYNNHKKSDKFYEDKPQNYNEDFGIKLSMWYFEQCDPKKCSGMQLKARGLLTTLSLKAKFNGIVLTPTAQQIISPADQEIIQTSGIAVIDCSWAHFD